MSRLRTDIIQVHPIRLRNGTVEHLVLRRSSDDELCPNAWQVVTGQMHDAESTRQAAARELLEETGLVALRWCALPNVASFFFEPFDAVVLSPILACEVDPDSTVSLSPEHSEYSWVELGRALERLDFTSQIDAACEIQRRFPDGIPPAESRFGR